MDRPIINRFPCPLKKSIPAVALAGLFFFSVSAQSENLRLATDLFEKGEWDLCHRECKRALLVGTPPTERFQLLDAMANDRSGMEPSLVAQELQSILSENRDCQVSAIAAYELGRLQWQIGQPGAAFDSLSLSFQSTTNKQLFLRSSCSLFLLLKEHPALKKNHGDLVSQINTSRDLWCGALFSECAKPDPQKNQSKPPSWIIRFYRGQISPAIGDRCNLEPSCSEYYHQARVKHGLKSIPMIADRLVREPGVNQRKEKPVVMASGRIRYGDPVEDHDFWMKK